jgi:hypothetical protein
MLMRFYTSTINDSLPSACEARSLYDCHIDFHNLPAQVICRDFLNFLRTRLRAIARSVLKHGTLYAASARRYFTTLRHEVRQWLSENYPWRWISKLEIPGLHAHLTWILSIVFCGNVWKASSVKAQSALEPKLWCRLQFASETANTSSMFQHLPVSLTQSWVACPRTWKPIPAPLERMQNVTD